MKRLFIYKGFDEKTYQKIAISSGGGQISSDVRYMRMICFRAVGTKKKIYAERIDNIAAIMGYMTSDALRIVGVCVSKEYKGRGLARFLVKRALQYARDNGAKKVVTRTKDGVDFYQRVAGARITGMTGEDFIMEMDV